MLTVTMMVSWIPYIRIPGGCFLDAALVAVGHRAHHLHEGIGIQLSRGASRLPRIAMTLGHRLYTLRHTISMLPCTRRYSDSNFTPSYAQYLYAPARRVTQRQRSLLRTGLLC